MTQDTQFLLLMSLAVAVCTWGVVHIVLAIVRPDDDRLKQRLANHWKEDLTAKGRLNIQKQAERLPAFLAGNSTVDRLSLMLRQAWPDASLGRFLITIALAAAGGAVLGYLLMGVIGSLVLTALGAAIPLLVVNRAASKRQRLLMEQLVEALDFLARILRAGHSLGSGFQMIADELPDPIASEFRLAYEQHSLGRPVEQALTDMSNRIASTEFAFFVTSVLIQRQTGGDLAIILDNLSATIRTRVRFRQHLKAQTAEGRVTGWILAGMPLGCFVLAYAMNPGYAGVMLTTPIGRMLLVSSLVLQLIGLLLIRKIVNFEA